MAKQRVEKLNDGTPYLAATYYEDGTELLGEWQVGVKIDGIRYIRSRDRIPRTRQGTAALPNVAYVMPEGMDDAELFRTDWSTSMSLKANTIQCMPEDFYSLNPIDPRLVLIEKTILTPEYIIRLRDWAMEQGYEGLVLRQGNTWVKVVPLRYADVMITGFYEGKGRLAGTFGGFTTHHGNVGGGFSDEMRHKIWTILQNQPAQLVGKIVQAKFREFTKYGKLRMPVFHRFRFDKAEENIDGSITEDY